MRDQRTEHLNLPLPSLENELQEDCPRIGEALQRLDANAAEQQTALAGLRWNQRRLYGEAQNRPGERLGF